MNKKYVWGATGLGAAALGAGAYLYYRRRQAREVYMPVTWEYQEINAQHSMLGVDAPGVESSIGREGNEMSSEGTK